MSFSDDYITKLATTTGITVAQIRAQERDLIDEVYEILGAAKKIEPSGRLTKRVVALVLKERDFVFI